MARSKLNLKNPNPKIRLFNKVNTKTQPFAELVDAISSTNKAMQVAFAQCNYDTLANAAPISKAYVFSKKARRAICFAQYQASTRDTDEVTNHITLDDLQYGIERERRQIRIP
jgi:hypothetical protein